MTILAEDELAIATELIAQVVAEGLELETPLECAADLELLALATQNPFCWPDSPPELTHALVRVLGRRGDELAAGVLAAMARLAGEPLAGLAAAEARRLAGSGIVSPFAAALGRVGVAEAYRLDVGDGAAEVWVVVLDRPGTEAIQPMTVFVEHEPWGALIVGAALGEPMARQHVDSLLARLDGASERVTAATLAGSLRAALDAMVRNDVGLEIDAGRVLPLLELALTGHAGRLPWPQAIEPDLEEIARESADSLTESFAMALEEAGTDPELLEHGPFVAHTMLDWKLDDADGDVVRWDAGDLREFLLDWFPRKVTCDESTIPVATAAVIEFLRFLDDEELLDAPVPVKSLAAAVRRLRPAFERACRDPANWGPAKRLALEMLGDGIDITDKESAEQWLEDYDGRLLAGPPASATRGAPDARKREQRKAARQARKRNRR